MWWCFSMGGITNIPRDYMPRPWYQLHLTVQMKPFTRFNVCTSFWSCPSTWTQSNFSLTVSQTLADACHVQDCYQEGLTVYCNLRLTWVMSCSLVKPIYGLSWSPMFTDFWVEWPAQFIVSSLRAVFTVLPESASKCDLAWYCLPHIELSSIECCWHFKCY
jgi:hypothetical protein